MDWWEVFAEIAALLRALEWHGRGRGDPECHEVVSRAKQGKAKPRNGMEEAQSRQLPPDEASIDGVHDEAWQHKITPETLYCEVSVDPRSQARHVAALAEINARQATLAQVRKARELTQSTLAETLEMDQSEVSRLEYRSNMLLSTLRSFIRATGGELQLIATFPDAEPVQLLVGSNAPNESL